MTRSKNKRPPNAFLFKSFDGLPSAMELPDVPRNAACFSFSPIGLRPPQNWLYCQRHEYWQCPDYTTTGTQIRKHNGNDIVLNHSLLGVGKPATCFGGIC